MSIQHRPNHRKTSPNKKVERERERARADLMKEMKRDMCAHSLTLVWSVEDKVSGQKGKVPRRNFHEVN